MVIYKESKQTKEVGREKVAAKWHCCINWRVKNGPWVVEELRNSQEGPAGQAEEIKNREAPNLNIPLKISPKLQRVNAESSHLLTHSKYWLLSKDS